MDRHLEFMATVPQEQLKVFVDTLLEKGGLSENLSISDVYKQYGENYSAYWWRIEQEYREFGSNTFVNIFSEPDSYEEILKKVLKQCKVKYYSSDSIEEMENQLLEKIIKDMWGKLSQSERIAILSDLDGMKDYNFDAIGGLTSSVLIQLFRAGGFASYKITLIIVNAMAKAILGRGLTLAANAGLARVLSIATGPIGIILTALWSIYDLAGPAYRVIIPCTILIAAYRKMEENNTAVDNEYSSDSTEENSGLTGITVATAVTTTSSYIPKFIKGMKALGKYNSIFKDI